MVEVLDAERASYKMGDVPQKWSTSQRIHSIVQVTIIVIRVVCLSVLVALKNAIFRAVSLPRRSMKGQVALVTGGGNGLGRAIVLRLASEGCHVAIADIDGNAASKVAEEAMKCCIKAVGYNVDVSDEKQIIELKTHIEKDIGPVDILVNNAGLVPQLSLHNGPAEHVGRIIDVNLVSQVWTVRTFLPEMKKRRSGHILTISSMMAHLPCACAITYSTTKAGATAFLRGVEREIKLEGLMDDIKVSYVFPYFIATRRDLCDILRVSPPPISPDYCADKIVDGILANNREIYIPGYFYYALKIVSILPYEACNLVRDYIMKEKESVRIDYLNSTFQN